MITRHLTAHASAITFMSAIWPVHTFPLSIGWRQESPARRSILELGADIRWVK
jgi:hypothetical protein